MVNMKIISIIKIIICFVLIVDISLKTKEEWKSRAIYQIITDRFAVPKGQSFDEHCDLHRYCGGNYRGVTSKLDYIKELGFNAIWISPILKNLPQDYHGYAFIDLYNLNENFGTESDFVEFINEAHKRDIWIMVDVVANHVAPVGTDYRDVKPFNDPSHYHDYCNIEDKDWAENQWRVENCRLVNLPDLKQENEFVQNTLLNWIKDLIIKYNIDGIRIDTVPEVPKWFWKKFANSSGVFQIGEVFNGNISYVSGYQRDSLDSVLNYPLFFTMRDCFGNKGSFNQMETVLKNIQSSFTDVDALGVFLDNHDNSRFLSFNGNKNNFINGIVFSLLTTGIPILYYGDEQYFSGGNDPFNREIMFSKFNQESDLYNIIKKIMNLRKDKLIWTRAQIQRYADHDFYAFTRGDVLACFTNKNYNINRSISYIEYPQGTKLCNVLDWNDCVYFRNGKIDVSLNQLPKVYVVVNEEFTNMNKSSKIEFLS